MISQASILTLLYGSGINTFLYLTQKDNMIPKDYLFNYGYVGLFYIPTSFTYNMALKKLRQSLFPFFTDYQLKNFSLMYFISKPAMLFDVFFIHFLYQGMIGVTLFTFCQQFYNKKEQPEQEFTTLRKPLENLIRTRIFLSVVSLLIDVWLPQIEHKTTNFKADPHEVLINPTYKKLYVSKQSLFAVVWQYAIINQYFKYVSNKY